MNQRNKIKSKLTSLSEAKVVVNRDDLESVVPSLGDDDVVKVVDEQLDEGDFDDNTVQNMLGIIDTLVDNNEPITINNIKLGSIFYPGPTFTDADDEIINQMISAYNDYDESDNLALQESKSVRPRMTKNKLIENILNLK